jgi:hypothetical protein
VASGSTTTLTGDLRVGGVTAAKPFDGRIAEFCIYNVALSGANITSLVTSLTEKWISAPAPGGAPMLSVFRF